MAFWNKNNKNKEENGTVIESLKPYPAEAITFTGATITLSMEEAPKTKMLRQEEEQYFFSVYVEPFNIIKTDSFAAEDLIVASDDNKVFVCQKTTVDEESEADICAQKRNRQRITTVKNQTYEWDSSCYTPYNWCCFDSAYHLKDSIVASETKEDIETPMEWFRAHDGYKLITSEVEFERYLESDIDIDTWCLRKVYWSMKNYGLDEEWVLKNASAIGLSRERFQKLKELYEIANKDYMLFKLLFTENIKKVTCITGVAPATFRP